MEFQVRDARVTDIERITTLVEHHDERWRDHQLNLAADLLRQLIYMPSAAVMVAVEGRQLLGVGVLALRPSVTAGGLVGTIDLLAVEQGLELGEVVDSLLRELVRSARNKGCAVLEGEPPTEPAELARWEKMGFTESGNRLTYALARVPAHR